MTHSEDFDHSTFIHVRLFHQSTDLISTQVKHLEPILKTEETITPILITCYLIVHNDGTVQCHVMTL
jgi:hypothetical protein